MAQTIIALLQQLILLLKDLRHHPASIAPPPPEQPCARCAEAERNKSEKRYTKKEVMRRLNISLSTYDRYKKEGIIKVESSLARRDVITEEALQEALKESIRKGRI